MYTLFRIINNAWVLILGIGAAAMLVLPDANLMALVLCLSALAYVARIVVANIYHELNGWQSEPVAEAKPKKQHKQQVDEIPSDSRPPVHVVQHTLFGTVEAVQDKPEWVLQAEQRTGKTLRFDGQNWIAA